MLPVIPGGKCRFSVTKGMEVEPRNVIPLPILLKWRLPRESAVAERHGGPDSYELADGQQTTSLSAAKICAASNARAMLGTSFIHQAFPRVVGVECASR